MSRTRQGRRCSWPLPQAESLGLAKYGSRIPKVRAHALLELGRVPEALDAAKAALNDIPDYVELWYIRGLAEERLGNIDQARRALQTAVELAGEHAEAERRLELLANRKR